MNFIDTHTHLYLKEFSNDVDEVIERAVKAGVDKFFLPAIDSAETSAMFHLEKKFPGKCFAMAGLHPCSVKENYKEELSAIEKLLSERKFAAIGETGLDFYWDKTFVKEQYESLTLQAGWALQYHIPLVLHTRNALQETIDVIKTYNARGLKGIFHCFGGTLQNAKDIIAQNFYLGIGGVVTYKNSGLAEIIKDIDLKHIVLETDAPYLTPVPYRGKRNESSYLIYIAQKIGEIKNIALEVVAEQTTRNAKEIFSL
ncbi:TatD family deoxyribonuclease [Ginsengibacter hankyongi]|uniref:TatD family deoxyribonuclease n=1 Tax=Ginsengibacter hankyongi TaxID=2607284 RepID=A0A5J5IP24_9BACT|nr:TatD family hydrolase [Ginsengibacter hankyongi]KAA9041757.1 TatD family deoxyribonuclease [Ginsengibacter hankyongi]